MYANTQLAAEVLRAGASGFIVKDAAGPELIAAVHVVLRGRTYDLAEHVLARLPRSGLTIAERSQAEVALTGIAGENQPPPFGRSPRGRWVPPVLQNRFSAASARP